MEAPTFPVNGQFPTQEMAASDRNLLVGSKSRHQILMRGQASASRFIAFQISWS